MNFMKLRPYGYLVANKKQINEWRAKKNGCKVTIRKKKDSTGREVFTYTIEHHRGIYDSYAEDSKHYETLDQAGEAAEKWIDMYSFLNSPLLALSHYK
ncbi:hypothetical protein QO009_003086 [Brevibacillus aydinogluensis]|uniref:hypothetical protein n=1 Tax=Brevibacillus aydinogluensis TaxID=927786 RepID=UPI0028936EA8|nr:hypothetical protein [Brevibacillus aydinogluensis]MDT3417191.1 hypothetical protein [Brevibacillus aydinogluensis]